MSIYRTPSPLEFTYIAADLPHYSPLVNQFFVIGNGDIDTERLRQALAQAVDANPGYRLRLQGYWGWRQWDRDGLYPTVDDIDAPEWDSTCSDHAPCLGNPIDLRTESPCQITKIRTRQGTHILFRTHHAITDGRGTVHLMNETFRILRGEAPLGSHSKLTEWDIAMRENRPANPVTEYHCLPVIKGTVDAERAGYQWRRFDWQGNKNKFAAKLIYGCAKLAREHFGEGKVLFRIPADLRRFAAEGEGFPVGNCSGAIDLEITEETSLNQIRSDIIRAMRQNLELAPFEEKFKYIKWLPKSFFRAKPLLLKKMHAAQSYRMSGIISYMGDVNNDEFRCEGFEPTSQFGVPIPFESRPLFIAACTYNDITNIIVGCPRAVCSMDELGAFCTTLAATLDQL